MRLSRGLLVFPLAFPAVKAQQEDDSASPIRIATAFPATLLMPAVITLGGGDTEDTGTAFPVSLLSHSETTLAAGDDDDDNTAAPVPPPPPPPNTAQASDTLPTITIPPSADYPYSRIIRPYTGTSTITEAIISTEEGSGVRFGTVIIEVPGTSYLQFVPGQPGALTFPPSRNDPYYTVIQAYPGPASISAPATVTIPAQGTLPGTIGGEGITIPPSPDSPFTTIIRPHQGANPIPTAVTILVPGTSNEPGTIIIETPSPQSPSTQAGGQGGSSGGGGSGQGGAGQGGITGQGGTGQGGSGQPENQPVFIPPSGDNPFATIMRPHPGSEEITEPVTFTIQPSGNEPGTIIIETPSQRHPQAATKTITLPPDPDSSFVTLVRGYDGDEPITEPTTITIPGEGNEPGTIIIETPAPTRTRGGEITIPSDPESSWVTVVRGREDTDDDVTEPTTITIQPSGNQPGTIIIETPAPTGGQTGDGSDGDPITIPSGPDSPFVTIFRPHAGAPITAPVTLTRPASGGQPGTVFIETPDPSGLQTDDDVDEPITLPPGPNSPFSTIYRLHNGDPITEPITITVPPSGGRPGTIIIETPSQSTTDPGDDIGSQPITIPPGPGNPFVTIYRPHTGTEAITIPVTTTVTGAPGEPGTIIIETPAPTVTPPVVTRVGTRPTDNITIPPGPGRPYVTIYREHTGDPITVPITITQTPTGDEPGTIIIETPAPTSDETRTGSGSPGGPITIPPSPDRPYVTIYREHTGDPITAPITLTQPPSGGQPGTYIIETPAPVVTFGTGADGFSTIFRQHTGDPITAPITLTQPPSGGQPGTIIIETPAPQITVPPGPDRPYVTIYRQHTGDPITAPITITKPPSGGQPGTIFIETPGPMVETETQTDDGRVTIPSSDDDEYVTVYRPYPGPGQITAPITLTQPPAGGQPGTIFIETPVAAEQSTTSSQEPAGPITIPPGPTGPYVTIYRPYPGPGVISSPITIIQPPSEGRPGTVFIETPNPSAPAQTQTPGGTITVPTGPDNPYVTIYRPYPGPDQIHDAITITVPPVSGRPGTIIIETPTPIVFTKIIQTPLPMTIPEGEDGYVTIYRPHTSGPPITAPVTVEVRPPRSGLPGTVIIETPVPEEEEESPTSSLPPPVTLPPDDDNYVTIFRPHTGAPITAPITITTIAPSGGQPGTVIIETPVPQPATTTSESLSTAPPAVTIPPDQAGYVTIYRPHVGDPITAPITVGTIAPTLGRPGTVIIETPAPVSTPQPPPVTIPPGEDGYVTIYRPHTGAGVITAPVTITTIAPSGGQPGTVIIETPGPQAATTTSATPNPPVTVAPAPEATYVTVFRPHTGPDQITAPVTVTTIAPSGGQPGTVIIETPTRADPTENPTTTVMPPPEASYVTVYRPHTGTGLITAPVTVTTIAPSGGQPGTVIIETPVQADPTENPTTTVVPSPSPEASYVTVYRPHTGTGVITVPVTITTIAPSGGQPGTVIIETPVQAEPTEAPATTVMPSPEAAYVTVYRPHTGTGVITAPVTITTIAPSGDQPGTVIIETPSEGSPDENPTTTVMPDPEASYVTVYRPHTGTGQITAPITVTTIEPTRDQPGTVIIETPVQVEQPTVTVMPSTEAAYVTIYRPHTGTDQITAPVTVTTIAPSGDQPGTVIIETPTSPVENPTVTIAPAPEASYVTVYRPHTGPDQITAPVTITTIAPSGDQPGTVIIETPTQASDNPTVTVAPQPVYITVYRPHTGTNLITSPVTVTTIEPTGDQPGTVIIETPAPVTPVGNPVVTVPPRQSYVTIFRPHVGTDQITAPVTVTTIEPEGDQPGTVIIETPTQESPADNPTVTVPPEPVYVTVFRPYTGTGTITAPVTVTTIEPEGDQPGTVIIETPSQAENPTSTAAPEPIYVTIFRPYTGTGTITAPVTVTTIEPEGGEPGTVIIETPTQAENPTVTVPPEPVYITIFRPYTGTGTITEPTTVTTIEPTGDEPGTVIVETPTQAQNPTTTVTPERVYVTIFRPYTGTGSITEPTTITTIEPTGDEPGTVIIETSTEAQNPTVTVPPEPIYVTIFRPHTGTGIITAPVTITTIEPTGGEPGTVIIETPVAQTETENAPVTVSPDPVYVTVFRPHTGADTITGPITVTTIEPTGDQPGTVIIETPALPSPAENPVVTVPPEPVYVTVFRQHSGPDRITEPVTITTIEPSGDQPGTVIIETPAPETQAPPVTIPPGPDNYVTVYRAHTGSDIITEPITITTIAPSGDQPGTVIIETPDAQSPQTEETQTGSPPVTLPPGDDFYVTVFRPYNGIGTITAPVTITTIAPSGNQPGTVIIETPAPPAPSPTTSDTYVTVFRPYTGIGTITEPLTVTTIAPEGGEPGTVIIETPESQAPPLTILPGPDNTYVTIFRPHTGTDTITAPVTITTIEPTGDEPGTVIIETPGPLEPAPATTVSPEPLPYVTIYRQYTGTEPITAPVTSTQPPAGGEPGTVFIETPGPPPATTAAEQPYVTIYRLYTGTEPITAPVTSTQPPAGGEPGTVFIETPGPLETAPPTTAAPEQPYVTIYRLYTGTDPITAPVTSTQPPSGGEPGTVFIETPGPKPTQTDTYVTVYRPYTGTEPITAPVTSTQPPSGGKPGTVFIETLAPEPTQTQSDYYVTIYRPYTGTEQITAPVTSTQPPSGGEPGTVFIETLAPEPTQTDSYVTVYRPYTGTEQITAPVTVTTIAPSNGEPGTVIIETVAPETETEPPPPTTISPAAEIANVTIVRQYTGAGIITAPITSYEPPAASGEPGTVIIETPGPETEAPPPTTVFPTPEIANVTIVRQYSGPDIITAPITSYEPPSSAGEPGTVIIETPAPETEPPPPTTIAPEIANVTIVRQYNGPGVITAPITSYEPPAASGEPGTVIIETPGPATTDAQPTTEPPEIANVTIVRQYSGTGIITAPITSYEPPSSAGEPGTVIIETPAPETVATTDAQTTAGPPGVTIPPSPQSPNITIIRPYAGPGVITAPITSYEPPAASGEPGTVIIETPVPETTAEPTTEATAEGTAEETAPETTEAFPTTAPPPVTIPPSPQSPNVTIIRAYSGPDSITAPVTRYIEPETSGGPGTVLIETPVAEVTTQPADATLTGTDSDFTGGPSLEPETSELPTAPTAATTHGEHEPGVLTQPPAPEDTSATETADETETSAGPEPESTSESPAPDFGTDTLTVTHVASDAITIDPDHDHDHITLVQPNTRFPGETNNITAIIAPSNGESGTHIIFTPVTDSSVFDTDTTNPGIQLPSDFVTMTQTITVPGDPETLSGTGSHDHHADPTTTGSEMNVMIIPPSGTEPGTILTHTSVYLDQSLSRHENVTITREGPSTLTGPFTTYSPPGASGDPGTIIIEIPNMRLATQDETTTEDATDETSATDEESATDTDETSATDEESTTDEAPSADASTTDEAVTMDNTLTSDDPSTVEETSTTIEASAADAPSTTDGPTATEAPTTTEELTTTDDAGRNITIFRAGPAGLTAPVTTYEPPASRGDPGTVIIETPAGPGGPDNVTITREGPDTLTGPVTSYEPPATSGEPGTIIVETPPARNIENVTVTREGPETLTGPVTTYEPPASSGDPGTVIIETPPGRRPDNVTITREGPETLTGPVTTYEPPASSGEPGTIIIETPAQRRVENVTVTSEGPETMTEAMTTYEPPASSGDPGTILILTPAQRRAQNVTITTEGPETMTEPMTTYEPPASSEDPGTILIITPAQRRAQNVTITREGPSTLTGTFTTYEPPASPGDPGTIVIETLPAPGPSNVTITREGPSTLTGTFTTYEPPGSSGGPGTVIIETPPPAAPSNVTITREGPSTITGTITTYEPPGASGDPGTVIIETPPASNVTITREGPSTLTGTFTTYGPPGAAGDPGTIIIETPPPPAASNVTTTRAGAPTLTETITTYEPPGSSGDPGTVIIETPPPPAASNVTITREGPSTLTGTFTTYSAAGSPGDPGTVIIETPPPPAASNVTITREGPSTLTGPFTTYSPPGSSGGPGTVIIETPPPAPQSNITVTTEAPSTATATGPVTTYVPPTSSGAPGTVLIITPAARPTTTSSTTTTTSSSTSTTTTSTTSSSTTSSSTSTTTSTTTSRTTTSTTSSSTTSSTTTTSTTSTTTSRSTTTTTSSSSTSTTTTSTTTSRSTTTTTSTTSSAQPQATVQFDCDVYGYLIQKRTLYRVDIATGKATLIRTNIGPGGNINGMGYNRFDNYIYAMVVDDTGSQLIRIGGDGGWTLMSARVTNRNIILGDIDNQGRFWFSDTGRPWWAIDLHPGSANYGKIILSGTATHDDYIADWAFVPGGGDYMYAVQYTSDSSTLVRFSRTTYTWQTIKAFGHITGSNVWGALYASADGNLYGSENISGNIYRFAIAPTVKNPVFLSSGPQSSSNDGARCIDSESLVVR
ncbi:hypothetical protein ACJZ2D_011884 [Fusarium nematophilum]